MMDQASAVPEGAEVYYQGSWVQINSAECVPPYQFMVWEFIGPGGRITIQVPVSAIFEWRRPATTNG